MNTQRYLFLFCLMPDLLHVSTSPCMSLLGNTCFGTIPPDICLALCDGNVHKYKDFKQLVVFLVGEGRF